MKRLSISCFIVQSILFVCHCARERCLWQRIDEIFAARNVSHPVEQVLVSENCGYYQDSREVHMLFFEEGANMDWRPASAEITSFIPDTGIYGLDREMEGMKKHTWTYLCLFAEDAEQDCLKVKRDDIYDDKQRRWRCFASGSVHAWWVAPHVYQMNLVLARGHQYRIALIAGMDGCRQPLESLGSVEKKLCPREISEECPGYCATYELDFQPSSIMAGFEVHIPQELPPMTLLLSPISSDGNHPVLDLQYADGRAFARMNARSDCSYHSRQGAWVQGRWTTPFGCRSIPLLDGFVGDHRDRRKRIGGVKNAAIMMTAGEEGGNVKIVCGKVFVVGDSHMIRSQQLLAQLFAAFGCTFDAQFNVVMNESVTFDFSKQHWQTSQESILETLTKKVRLAGRNGMVLWWYGSHASVLSPAEVAYSVGNISNHLSRFIEEDSMPCVLVAGILDSQHEAIPLSRYGLQMKFYQNPWRVKAQNRAIRESVEHFVSVGDPSRTLSIDAGVSAGGGAGIGQAEAGVSVARESSRRRFHFLDFYDQSLALHYDGHYVKDAVHMSPKFYSYVSKTLAEAALRKCFFTQD